MSRTLGELQQLQALPLAVKIKKTEQRIKEWVDYYGEDGVYVSFSGGKDSTVLLDIARRLYPNMKAVFVDVPTQYPELRSFATSFENVDVVRPKISFMQVCEKYGFPLISKEVSECVCGARKYMTSVLEQESIDRQTDRQRTPYDWCMADLLGIDRRKDKENPEYKNIRAGIIPSNADIVLKHHLLSCKKGERHYYDYETRRILGTNARGVQKIIEEMTEEEIEQSPVRFKILLGKYKHKEKGKETNEYSNMFDKSRYQFYLDAPFEISNQCCKIMKKEPLHRYGKQSGRVAMTAQMATESRLRTQQWLKNGCNAFESKKPISNPMSFWTEQDVLLYIYEHKLPICSVYGDVVKDTEVEGQYDFEDLGIFDLGRPTLKTTGCDRTGCCLCGFGAHMPDDDRFLRLKETHPKIYGLLDKCKNNGYTMREAIEWTNEHGNLNIKL